MSRRFGSIRKLPSKRYQASYLDPRTGKRVPALSTFATRTAANHWLVDIQSSLRRGDLPDLDLGRTLFKDWALRWIDSKQIRAKTVDDYEGMIERHLIPWFGRMRLNTITRADVTEFVAFLISQHSEHVATNCKTVLSSLMNEALHNGAISKNPAWRIKVKRARRRDMVFLSRQEVQRLAYEISHQPVKFRGGHVHIKHYPAFGLLVRFAAETGLRAGEIAALRVGRIDVINRRIYVAESVAEVKKKHHPSGLLYEEPKTYERRSVPLPETLANELADHLFTRPSDPEAFVFTAAKGGPMRHRNFYRYFFKPAVKRAKLNPETRFHDLGHSSIKVTYDRYGHLFPHMEEDLTVRMDAAYKSTHSSADMPTTTDGV